MLEHVLRLLYDGYCLKLLSQNNLLVAQLWDGRKQPAQSRKRAGKRAYAPILRSVSFLSFWLRLGKIGPYALFPALFRDWAGCLRQSHDWVTNRLFWLSSADKRSWQQGGTSINSSKKCVLFLYILLYFLNKIL